MAAQLRERDANAVNCPQLATRMNNARLPRRTYVTRAKKNTAPAKQGPETDHAAALARIQKTIPIFYNRKDGGSHLKTATS